MPTKAKRATFYRLFLKKYVPAGAFVGLRHLFAGLRSLAGTHNDGLSILYFMTFKEWACEMNNANKGEEASLRMSWEQPAAKAILFLEFLQHL